MIRFWSERHLGGADLDAEVAAGDHHRVAPRSRIASSAATASAFSIFAITRACEPAPRSACASAATSAARADERERDVVDAERERERRGRRGPSRVSDGIGQRHAGRLTPLCGSTDAADDDRRSSARPRSTSLDAEPDEAVVDEDLVARAASTDAEDGRAHRAGRPRRAASSPAITTVSPLDELDGAVEVADAELRPLQVGDQRERPAGRAPAASRTSARSRACSSCVPCEKLSRAPSMPASTSAASVAGVADAGPIVATIFVRRGARSRRAR